MLRFICCPLATAEPRQVGRDEITRPETRRSGSSSGPKLLSPFPSHQPTHTDNQPAMRRGGGGGHPTCADQSEGLATTLHRDEDEDDGRHPALVAFAAGGRFVV